MDSANSVLEDATSVAFAVRGRPPVPRARGSITAAEKAWRAAVVLAAQEQIGPRQKALVEGWPWLTVRLDFYFASMDTDVDNMPKPILDTLFSPGTRNDNRRHLSTITGVIFPSRDDSTVRELWLRKSLAGDEGGLGVSVSITESTEQTSP